MPTYFASYRGKKPHSHTISNMEMNISLSFKKNNEHFISLPHIRVKWQYVQSCLQPVCWLILFFIKVIRSYSYKSLHFLKLSIAYFLT